LTCILLGPEFEREAAVIAALQEGSTPPNGNGISPWQLADTLQSLKERFGWTQHQLGKVVGKSRDFVTGYLALSNIVPEVRQYLLDDPKGAALSTRHLRYIGRTPPRLQMKVVREIVAEGLSTKDLEQQGKRRSKKRVMFKMRMPRPAEAASSAEPRKEWRKVLRQLGTALRRLDRLEKRKRRQAEEAIRGAQLQLRQIKAEAKEKRALLEKELRRTKRKVERIGL
jgi:ParB-like chromosome segregation protein Spo0J